MIEKIRKIVDAVAEGESEAVLTTISPEGRPHATWMGTVTTSNLHEILTITSPDSEKVVNIQANPEVEWMFTDESKEAVIYFRGRAEEVSDMENIKASWERLSDKRRAFFLRYFNTGIGFSVLLTRVSSVIYCCPQENRKTEISVDELIELESGKNL